MRSFTFLILLSVQIFLPSCITIYHTSSEPSQPTGEFAAYTDNANVTAALEEQGLKKDYTSMVRIRSNQSRIPGLSTNRCIVFAFTLFLIPCWENDTHNVTFKVDAPGLDDSKTEVVESTVESSKILFFPLLLIAGFWPNNGFDGPTAVAAGNNASEIRKAVLGRHKEIDKARSKIKQLLAQKGRYPMIISQFSYYYDSYSDSSKQVSMRFFNNTGKDISRIAVTFQPARSLFSLTPPPRVGQFALVERIQNVTLPANQLSSTVTFPSVGTGSEVRAVFLERIILTFSDGTTRAYNSWQVKNMVHEAPVALFPK